MVSKLPKFETPFESYQATKVLGEGGAGRVYEAVNKTGESFAIKCLAPERITTERQKRFKNEIIFCQNQTHTNIVCVIDTGVIYINDVKCPFYVMPKYAGTLRTYMKSIKPESVLTVFSQILDGTEAAHLLNVCHRDLKPENILWDDDNNQVVITDFGIAHFEEEEIYTAVETKVTARMANFQYSAPEQRTRGAKVDHRADIFSLGLLLNELFTGEIPHGTGYTRIADVSPNQGYLDNIVEAMIQQNPEKRLSSILEVKKELIGHKNAFIALQRLEESKKKIVPTSEPPEFEDIFITGLDYENGVLCLFLNRNIPPGWAQEFQYPRSGHSSILGYGPESFQISGNRASIGIRENENTIQQVVNHAKDYVSAANRGYVQQLQAQAAQEEERLRERYKKEVAEAEARKNILSRIKL